jgi:hypothetical protein
MNFDGLALGQISIYNPSRFYREFEGFAKIYRLFEMLVLNLSMQKFLSRLLEVGAIVFQF